MFLRLYVAWLHKTAQTYPTIHQRQIVLAPFLASNEQIVLSVADHASHLI